MGDDLTRPLPDRDLDSHLEVDEMVRRFYRAVTQDDLLGPVFNDVAQLDWSDHLPKLTAYWCRALFGAHGYEGDALTAHEVVSAKEPFTEQHFERWLDLFYETVDLGWTGTRAEKAKTLATEIARTHMDQLASKPLRPPCPTKIDHTATPGAIRAAG